MRASFGLQPETFTMVEPTITVNSTVSDVCEYLKNLNLDKFQFIDVVDNFLRESVDGKILINLEKQDLSDLGLIKLVKRNLFYNHLQELRKHPANNNTKPRNLTPSISTKTINEYVLSTNDISHINVPYQTQPIPPHLSAHRIITTPTASYRQLPGIIPTPTANSIMSPASWVITQAIQGLNTTEFPTTCQIPTASFTQHSQFGVKNINTPSVNAIPYSVPFVEPILPTNAYNTTNNYIKTNIQIEEVQHNIPT
eukprot:135611_1